MIKKLSAMVAGLALAGSITLTGSDAEAGRRHRGALIGGAALGLFALGTISGRSDDDREGCYRGPRECRWVRGACYRERFGDRECEEGYQECSRPLYCN